MTIKYPLQIFPSNGYLLLLMLVTLVFGACSHAPYPEYWPAIKKAVDECPNLSGSYRNLPERPKNGSPLGFGRQELSELLVPEKKIDILYSASHVELIQHENDSFEIIVREMNDIVAQKTYQRSGAQFDCNAGMTLFDSTLKVMTDFASFVPCSESLYIGKAVDGSLVLKKKITGVGISCFIFPAGGSGSGWLRYLPITD